MDMNVSINKKNNPQFAKAKISIELEGESFFFTINNMDVLNDAEVFCGVLELKIIKKCGKRVSDDVQEIVKDLRFVTSAFNYYRILYSVALVVEHLRRAGLQHSNHYVKKQNQMDKPVLLTMLFDGEQNSWAESVFRYSNRGNILDELEDVLWYECTKHNRFFENYRGINTQMDLCSEIKKRFELVHHFFDDTIAKAVGVL